MVIGVWMGIRGAWKRGGTFDNVSTGTSLTLYSMPEWWLGLMLIAVFAVGIGPIPGMFPTGGLHSVDVDPSSIEGVLDTIWHLTLPVITLTLAYLADYALIMRSSLLDELGEDYLTTARAKGLRDVQVRNRHAVRNALLPTTTLVALSIGFIVAGAITVETVFSIPGPRPAGDRGPVGAGLLGAPGHLPGRVRRRDPGQPRRQPGLRPPRPPGPDMTTDATPTAASRPARSTRRRRRASWQRSWAIFRTHRAGMLGLAVLAAFALVALLAPMIAPAEGLEVTKATGGVLEPPSAGVSGSAPTTRAGRC